MFEALAIFGIFGFLFSRAEQEQSKRDEQIRNSINPRTGETNWSGYSGGVEGETNWGKH